jgi:argininosuccinate synthase
MNFEKAKYSINKGIWGTSVGGKETLTSNLGLPEEAWPTQVTETEPKNVELTLKKVNWLVKWRKIRSSNKSDTSITSYCTALWFGRDIHVGDTIIGIKGRVGFEAAAPMVIIKAHHTLEKHVLNQMAANMERSAIYVSTATGCTKVSFTILLCVIWKPF